MNKVTSLNCSSPPSPLFLKPLSNILVYAHPKGFLKGNIIRKTVLAFNKKQTCKLLRIKLIEMHFAQQPFIRKSSVIHQQPIPHAYLGHKQITDSTKSSTLWIQTDSKQLPHKTQLPRINPWEWGLCLNTQNILRHLTKLNSY